MIVQSPAESQPGFVLQRCLGAKKTPSKDGVFEVINESRTP